MSAAIDALVAAFAAASRAHFTATDDGDHKAANREADRVHQAFLQLRELGPAAREALLRVALESNDAAAVMAAVYSLKYDADRALPILARASRDRGILGFQASQAIKRWKAGEWQLE